MDSLKVELISIVIIYLGLGILAWYFLTHHWWFFILLAFNLTVIYVIVYVRCHDIDFIRTLGEKIVMFLMKKYGGEWLRDIQFLKKMYEKETKE